MRLSACTILLAGLIAGCNPPAGPAATKPLLEPTPATTSASTPRPAALKAAAPKELLTPEIRAAVEDVNSDDPQRQAAGKEVLRKVLEKMGPAGDAQAKAAASKRLQEEITSLVNSTDAEVRGRAAALLDFNQGLARFTAEVLALPDEQSRALMQWGLSDSGVSVVAQAFSPQTAVRAKAVVQLASMTGPEADWLLGRLVEDMDREVSVTAMDVAGDRKPSTELVRALFDKAVVLGLRQYGIPMGPEPVTAVKTITIHGHSATIYNYAAQQARLNDADIATEILTDWKSPLVGERLERFIAELNALPGLNASQRLRVFSSSSGNTGLYLTQLLQAYRPKSLITFAAAGAFGQVGDNYQINMNGAMYFGSARLDAMALLIACTGQDEADYGIVQLPQYGARWLILGGAPAEEAACEKLQAWWKKNSARFEEPKP